jgi:hypothetical protein
MSVVKISPICNFAIKCKVEACSSTFSEKEVMKALGWV